MSKAKAEKFQEKITQLTGRERRPYTGHDLGTLKTDLDASLLELSHITGGIRPSLLSKISSEGANLAAPMQILLRFYLRHPETIPLEEPINAREFYETDLGGAEMLHIRYFAPLFGVDRNSGYSWGGRSEPTGIVQAAMQAARRYREIHNLSPEQLLSELVDIHNDVIAALGVNPHESGGTWRQPAKNGDVPVLEPEKLANPVARRGRKPKPKAETPESDIKNFKVASERKRKTKATPSKG